MMKKFKIGDTVKCIHDDVLLVNSSFYRKYFNCNEEYTIQEIGVFSDNQHYILVRGSTQFTEPEHFVKILKTKDDEMNEKYIFFYNGPFSQWFKSDFNYRGYNFCTCEQFMMWWKAKVMGDKETGAAIFLTNNAKRQKELGREVNPFDPKLWDLVKQDVVYMGNYLKFSQNKELKKILLDTGNKILVEASPTDNIWGIGFNEETALQSDPSSWGLNLLGKALMEVRNTLKYVDNKILNS